MDSAARARLLNAFGCLLGWLACVGGAGRGNGWLGPAAAAALVGARVASSGRPRRELARVAAVGLFGAAVESAALGAGLYGYSCGGRVWWLPPAWVVGLWLLLGAALGSSLRFLDRRPALAAATGAAAGALGFALAARLGAARFIAPEPAGLAAVASLWSAALPLSFAVARLAGAAS